MNKEERRVNDEYLFCAVAIRVRREFWNKSLRKIRKFCIEMEEKRFLRFIIYNNKIPLSNQRSLQRLLLRINPM